MKPICYPFSEALSIECNQLQFHLNGVESNQTLCLMHFISFKNTFANFLVFFLEDGNLAILALNLLFVPSKERGIPKLCLMLILILEN